MALVSAAALPITAAQAAEPENRFRPSGPDGVGSPSPVKKPRWTIQDFENRAAANPVPGALLGLPAKNVFVLFSQCRAMSSTVFPALVAGETDAIVGDTPFAFASVLPGIAPTCFNPQNEHNIVVNPVNANHLVTSANEYRGNVHIVYVSFDRGANWSNVVLPGWTRDTGGTGQFSHMDSCGDPVLAISRDGTRLYYAGLVCNFEGPGNYQLRSGVAVAVSTDGGVTWSAPTMVHSTSSGNFFHDKQWMTVAPDGTVHVTWTRFQQTANGKFGASPIYIASSKSGGQSFSGPKQVSDDAHPFNQGSVPAVAPNGTIYVSYIASTPETGFAGDAVVLARSTDGGKKWINVQGPRIYDDYNCYPLQLPGTGQGRQTLSAQNYRIHSFPSIAVDSSTGRVHIVWTDNRAHPSCGYEKGGTFNPAMGNTQNQTWYIRTDNGTSFTAPVALSPPFDDTLFPAVAARDGKVLVGSYTRKFAKTAGGFGPDYRCSVRGVTVNEPPYPDGTLLLAAFGTGVNLQTNVCIDYAARRSEDGGQNFLAETRLSSESSNPWVLFTGSFIGDYTGVELDSNNRGVAVWTDFRGNPGTGSGRITPPNQDAIVRTLP
ncbi:MAG: sialidase family protein [Burkholderiaceae bacterium]